MVHRRIQRADEVLLEQHRLTSAQARAVRTLGRAGKPLLMSELAARLDVVARSATSLVEELEPMGIVARRRGTADARQVLVALTERGDALLPELVDRHGRAVAGVLEGLDDAEIAVLADLLGRVAHGPSDE